MATATQLIGDEPGSAGHTSRPSYTCPQCSHVLTVSGLDRHRIFSEPGDVHNPVMNGRCPECGLGLPGKNPS